jgi:hypothetical protein
VHVQTFAVSSISPGTEAGTYAVLTAVYAKEFPGKKERGDNLAFKSRAASS